MRIARVEGTVTATHKHPSFNGWRMVICQPVNAQGEPEGLPEVALDNHGAARGNIVLFSSDGKAAQDLVGDNKSPARTIIIGIVDEGIKTGKK